MLKVYINTNDEILFEHSELEGGYSEVFAQDLDTEKAFWHLQDNGIEVVAEDTFRKWRGGYLSNLPNLGGLIAWEGEPTAAELAAIERASELIQEAIEEVDASLAEEFAAEDSEDDEPSEEDSEATK